MRFALKIAILLGGLAASCAATLLAADLTLPAARPQPSEVGAEFSRVNVETWLDGILPYALDRGDVAGAMVVVVKDDSVLLEKGFGYADVASRKLVDPDTTLFRIGSVSKLFTWTAVMQLVQEGRLNLDADINTYLDFTIPVFSGKPVTLRNLMTHTAGFEETGKHLVAHDPRDALTLGGYIHSVLPQRIFPPGEIIAYSNYGAALAGYIVQRVSGEPFDTYIERHILDPLEMRHASFRQPLPEALRPLLSSGYRLGSGPAQPFEIVVAAPAGSGTLSGSDMARFMIEHLQAESGTGKGILRAETARQMHTSALATVSPDLHRIMLGFFELDRNGRRIIGHGGDTAWFHSSLYLWPDDHAGLFVIVNSQGRGAETEILRTLLFEEFADRYFPGPGRLQGPALQGRVDPAVARHDAASVAGQYELSRRMATSFLSLENLLSQLSVEADAAGELSIPALAALSGQVRKFREVAPYVWREVHGKNRVAAKMIDGRVAMLSEDEVSPALTLLPPSPWKNAAWLLPLTIGSLAVLALNTIAWAGAAGLRRYYGASGVAAQRLPRRYRWVRLTAAGVLVLMVSWFLVVLEIPARSHFAALVVDPLVMGLHVLSIVLFPAAAALALWNCVALSRSGRENSVLSRVWAVCLAVACGTTLWVALSFHLIGVSLQY